MVAVAACTYVWRYSPHFRSTPDCCDCWDTWSGQCTEIYWRSSGWRRSDYRRTVSRRAPDRMVALPSPSMNRISTCTQKIMGTRNSYTSGDIHTDIVVDVISNASGWFHAARGAWYLLAFVLDSLNWNNCLSVLMVTAVLHRRPIAVFALKRTTLDISETERREAIMSLISSVAIRGRKRDIGNWCKLLNCGE